MSANPVTFLPVGAPSGPLVALVSSLHVPDLDSALESAHTIGKNAPSPGAGSTRDLWEALATIAAADLGAARALEPHLDALAILRQADVDNPAQDGDGLWGVYAAEGGDDPLTAAEIEGHWSLTGTKPWCSLAGRLDHALVTAHLANGERGLFAVDLRAAGVSVKSGTWHARGLTEIPSGPVVFLDVTASPIGEPGWYLSRPGFSWGGIGVAACWYGGAVGLARSLFARVGEDPDPLMAMHLGGIDERLQSARRALAEAAELVDQRLPARASIILGKRVRATVAGTCEFILERVGHALGPAPLALDEEHAKRVADLELYIRQHHAEKDLASLGARLAEAEIDPW